MGKYNLIAAWGLILAAMFFLPITPVLIMACMVAVMMYSIGYIDDLTSFHPLVILDVAKTNKAAQDPAYRRKWLKRLDSALSGLHLAEGQTVAAYSPSSLRNTKLAMSLIMFFASLCFLLLVTFIQDDDSWDRYFSLIIFFTAVVSLSIGLLLALYCFNRKKFMAFKALECLEAKVYVFDRGGPDYVEMEKALKKLSEISPPEFLGERIVYDLDRSYCLAETGRTEEALQLLREAENHFHNQATDNGYFHSLRESYYSRFEDRAAFNISLLDLKMREISLCLTAGRAGEAGVALSEIRSRPSKYDLDELTLALYEAALALLEGRTESARSGLENILRDGVCSSREKLRQYIESESDLKSLAGLLEKIC